mgnify:CR=1 FL=1
MISKMMLLANILLIIELFVCLVSRSSKSSLDAVLSVEYHSFVLTSLSIACSRVTQFVRGVMFLGGDGRVNVR